MIPRLFRPRTERMIGGVCGGLGLYFGLDPVIIRLLFVVLAFTTYGLALFLYLILWLIMPNAPDGQQQFLDTQATPQPGETVPPASSITGPTVHLYSDREVPAAAGARKRLLALVLLGVGGLILLQNLGHFFGIDLAGVVLPLLLVGLGIYLLRSARA